MNNKMWLWVGVVAVLVAIGLWFWMAYPVSAPSSQSPALSTNDSTAAINQELKSTTVADPTQDLQRTNADANSL